jgi:hypothetical protein
MFISNCLLTAMLQSLHPLKPRIASASSKERQVTQAIELSLDTEQQPEHTPLERC